jgi:hypothetical protein
MVTTETRAKRLVRRPRGEDHWGATLTNVQAAEIRGRYTGRYGELTRFAAEYGVSVTVVWKLVHRKTWRDRRDDDLVVPCETSEAS